MNSFPPSCCRKTSSMAMPSNGLARDGVEPGRKNMYIIVVGGGKVGFHLAKELVDANHEVLIIEEDSQKAKEIADELGDIVLDGDGCEATVLEKAGTSRADMLLAVTGE